MRTLKKSLCLILCLAMMVGLCAIGASAVKYDDYKDKDKITYESAVTLLTALGVLEGDDKGTFRPTDELNRAEGAAIMTRLLQKEIDKNAVSSFSDMAGYTWAQPYVKFCEDQGIIAGYGNGKFGPGDKRTTSAFAKMLICALGYDAAKEGLVNDAAWEINTTRKVTSLSLAKGLDAYLPGKNVTRETAAQLAYNTLFATMVYSEGSSIAVSWVGNLLKGGDAIITVTEGTPIPNPTYDYNTNNPIDNVLQFCEAAFPALKLRTADDVYAIPTNFWFMGKSAVDKVYAASKLICTTYAVPVLARYTSDMTSITSARLYNDAGFAGLDLWAAKRGYIDLYENGEGFDDLMVVSSNSTARVLAAYAGAEAILLDMSELYEGYENDTNVDLDVTTRLVIKYPYLAQVISVIPGETRSVTLKVFRNFGAAITVNVPCEDYKKGDYVLVYDWGCVQRTKASDSTVFEANVIELKNADAKNGTLQTVYLETATANGYAQALKVGGDVLNIGSDAFAVLGPNPASTEYGVRAPKGLWVINTGLTAYMANGYVLGVVPDSVAFGDWVFVYATDGHGVGSPWNDGTTYVVGYLNQSAKKFETKVTTFGGTDADPVYPDTAYWTTVDEGVLTEKDDVYELNKDGELFEYGLRHDMPELALDADGNKIIADSKTVILIKNGNTIKAYTGIHNIPDYTFPDASAAIGAPEAGRVYALVPSEGAHAVAVFIDVTGMHGAPVEDADPVYLLGLFPGTKTLDDGTVVYTYACIKDGKLDVLMTKNPKAELEQEGLVIPIYDYTGKYVIGVKQITDDPAYILLNAANTTCTFENDTITFGDSTYAVAKDAVAYIYNRLTGKLTVTTPDCLPGLPAADVTAIATAKDKTILTIYYIYPSIFDEE